MRATTSMWWGSRTDSHDSQASPCLRGPAPPFSSGQYPYSRGPSYPSRQGAGNPFAMSTSIVMNGPQYRTLSAVIIHLMRCCNSLLGWGDDPGVGLRPVLSGSRISLNSPQAFRSLASRADTADKAGKIQRRDLVQPQKLWFFEARSAKKQRKTAGYNSETTAKTANE